MNKKDEPTRRDFLAWATGLLVAGGTAIGGLSIFRFMKPSVLPEGEPILKIGAQIDFPEGSTKIFKDKNVIIISERDGLTAISLLCTHLGCLVTRQSGGDFTCSCHGSKFTSRGKVTKGPAPKSLPCYEILQMPNGTLAVDLQSVVSRDKRYSFS